VWAVADSTLHRIRRGEGALAINLADRLPRRPVHGRGVAQALVSVLAILVMYAFNDLDDAPVDWNNRRRTGLIQTWRTGGRRGRDGRRKIVTLG
jgi:hypothetical protein